MRRGEVYDYARPETDERVRVVLLAADSHLRPAPMAADVVRGGIDAPPYSIKLAEVDPISGYALLVSIREIRAARLGEAPVCMLTGSTMARVNAALRDLFGV